MADELLEKAESLSLEERKDEAEKLKELGNDALRSRGDVEAAIDCYSKAIFLNPHDAVYYSNRSAAYLANKNWELAYHDAQAAIHLKPDWFKGYIRMSEALSAGKNWAGAVLAIEDGIATLSVVSKRNSGENSDPPETSKELTASLEKALANLRDNVFRGIKSRTSLSDCTGRLVLPLSKENFFVDGGEKEQHFVYEYCVQVARDCSFSVSPRLHDFAADCFVGLTAFEEGVVAVISDGGIHSGLCAITTLCSFAHSSSKAALALANLMEVVSTSNISERVMPALWQLRFVVAAVRSLAKASVVNFRSSAVIIANCLKQGKTAELFFAPSADDEVQRERRRQQRQLLLEEKKAAEQEQQQEDEKKNDEQQKDKTNSDSDEEENEEEAYQMRFSLTFQLLIDAARSPDTIACKTALQGLAFFLTHTQVGISLVSRARVPTVLVDLFVREAMLEKEIKMAAIDELSNRSAWIDLARPVTTASNPSIFALKILSSSNDTVREMISASLKERGVSGEALVKIVCSDDALD